MKTINYRAKNQISGRERGAAMIEMALVVPFLIFITAAIVEFGRWVNVHFVASRIAYETSRYASSLPLLEQGVDGTDADTDLDEFMASFDDHGNFTTVVAAANQSRVLRRAGAVISRQNLVPSKISGITISGVLDQQVADSNSNASDTRNKVVYITVTMPFSGFFSDLIGLNKVVARARTAYLF